MRPWTFRDKPQPTFRENPWLGSRLPAGAAMTTGV
jgi:hypothetical protein